MKGLHLELQYTMWLHGKLAGVWEGVSTRVTAPGSGSEDV